MSTDSSINNSHIKNSNNSNKSNKNNENNNKHDSNQNNTHHNNDKHQKIFKILISATITNEEEKKDNTANEVVHEHLHAPEHLGEGMHENRVEPKSNMSQNNY
jgi:hypothetical protein